VDARTVLAERTTISVSDSAGKHCDTLLTVRTMETLTVTRSGVGNGTVTSAPSGINWRHCVLGNLP
jgi:hypothetical protein